MPPLRAVRSVQHGPAMHMGQQQGKGDLARYATAASAGALILYGVRRGGVGGLFFSLAGVGIAARRPLGSMWRSAAGRAEEPLTVSAAITVQGTLDEVFEAFRDLDRARRVFRSVESIESHTDGSHTWQLGYKRLHMKIRARVVDEEPRKRIAWRTTEGSDFDGHGEIELRPAPGDAGTEVRVRGSGMPRRALPLRLAAHALRKAARMALFTELVRMRQLIEAGEVASGDARPPQPERRPVPGPEAPRPTEVGTRQEVTP